jgi:putative protease
MRFRSKPEIMSPAGYWPQLRAAIEAGADAVYFGLRHFTARAKVGFSPEELPEALATLHRRGVKGYVTFNTLVFDEELQEAARSLAAIAEAGADAIIVQDLGMVKLARAIAPDLEIHASTQMSVTSADGARLAQRLGATRVTLARELSLAEVRAIRDETECELEIFVHGALCVAYSGQCLSSEAWGGRSANRGQCAQACRLPYEMVVDGRVMPLGDARYLLSPGDLYALHQVPEIVDIGISALKIEGRYKDADYVALATRAYREAVDEAWAGREVKIDRRRELELQQVYSRGLGPFFLNGTDHQAVVLGRAPRHRGVLMGRVARVMAGAIAIEPSEANEVAPLKPGDGVVFDAADWRSPEEPEEGGRVFELERQGGKLELRFGNGAIRPERIRRGDLVWRTHDPDVDKAARAFTEAAVPVYKRPATVRAIAREGEPLVTEWRVGDGTVRVESPAALGTARNQAISEQLLRTQLGRLGNTGFELAGLELEVEGSPFAPASMLNQVRREAVKKLEQDGERRVGVRGVDEALDVVRGSLPDGHASDDARPDLSRDRQQSVLHLLVRTPEQLDGAIDERPESITLDYLDLYGLKPSIERVRAAGITVRVASPRVLKPGEERIADFLESCDCPILVRPAGLLGRLRSRELIGDFSLNAANEITAAELLSQGLERLTPAHDLNAAQITELARKTGAARLEVVAYHHLPVFHTEHCVFCRFLSTGTSYRDCGRPCESHVLELRDTAGRAHPVMADVGCRNTVFGAEAQQAAAHLQEWLEVGIRHFRLEFAHEKGDQVAELTRVFREALSGRMHVQDLARVLGQIAPGGVTEGSLYVPLPVLQ